MTDTSSTASHPAPPPPLPARARLLPQHAWKYEAVQPDQWLPVMYLLGDYANLDLGDDVFPMLVPRDQLEYQELHGPPHLPSVGWWSREPPKRRRRR